MAEVVNLSLRRYATEAEAKARSGASSVSETILNLAEELIDTYVGVQDRAVATEYIGISTGGSTSTLIDNSSDSPLNDADDDYFKFCILEILSGAYAGQRRVITASTRASFKVTVDVVFGGAIVAGVSYKIYQLSKFPRQSDSVHFDAEGAIVAHYAKTIPYMVNKATIEQIAFIIEKGLEYFSEGASDKAQENYTGYGSTQKQGVEDRIAPAARALLEGIRRRKFGQLLV